MPESSASIFRGKRILVTGGLGFIGSNLSIALAEAGAKVAIVDSLSSGCGGNIFNVAPMRNQLQIFEIDLCEQEKLLSSALFDENLDYVFSLAASIGHTASMQNPLADLHKNATAELTLLECIRKRSPRARIVHTGTRQIFGRPQYFPVDEDHPVHPVDINGIHKYCAEQYHRIYHEAHGIRSTVLRLTNTYGPRQLIRSPSQGVTGSFIGRALRKEEISLFGDGEQTRDFNYVSDVVEALMLAASNETCIGETYNLSGFNHSLKHFLEFLAEEEPLSVREVHFPPEQAMIDIGNFSASSTKFEKTTGWKPSVDLDQGLAETMKFFRANAACYL